MSKTMLFEGLLYMFNFSNRISPNSNFLKGKVRKKDEIGLRGPATPKRKKIACQSFRKRGGILVKMSE